MGNRFASNRIAAFLALAVVASVSLNAQISGAGAYGAGNDPRGTLGNPGTDENFLEHGLQYTMAEIEWSKIAAQKSNNADVKAVADTTVSQALPETQYMVAAAKYRKAKIPEGVTGKQKKESEKLNGLTGADFDKEYLNALVKLQHDDVGNLREESKESRDESLKAFAARTNDQTVERNDKAQRLQKQLSGK